MIKQSNQTDTKLTQGKWLLQAFTTNQTQNNIQTLAIDRDITLTDKWHSPIPKEHFVLSLNI